MVDGQKRGRCRRILVARHYKLLSLLDGEVLDVLGPPLPTTMTEHSVRLCLLPLCVLLLVFQCAHAVFRGSEIGVQ